MLSEGGGLMGTTRRIPCQHGIREWSAIASRLAASGIDVQMRMIDGQLALPDEVPGDDWRELRVSLSGWMVTIRRDGSALELVSWADPPSELQSAVAALANALID